jgi:hypothetical protein
MISHAEIGNINWFFARSVVKAKQMASCKETHFSKSHLLVPFCTLQSKTYQISKINGLKVATILDAESRDIVVGVMLNEILPTTPQAHCRADQIEHDSEIQ